MLSPRTIQATSGWVLGVLVWAMSGEIWLAFLGGVFGILVVWLSGDSSWLLTGGVVSSCVVALPILLWSWLFGRYEIAGWLITAAVSLVWLSLSVFVRNQQASVRDARQAVVLSVLGVAWILVSARHDWSPVKLLERIGSMGEDNGAFLNNVALTGTGWNSTLIPSSGDNGGVILGIFIAVGGTLQGITGRNGSAALDAGETLMRLYDSVSFLITGLCVVAGLLRRQKKSLLRDSSLCAAISFGAVVFLSGLYRAAHFSVLVLVALALTTLVFAPRGAFENRRRFMGVLLPMLPLLFLGQAWMPGIIVAALGASVYVGTNIRRVWNGAIGFPKTDEINGERSWSAERTGYAMSLVVVLGFVLLLVRRYFGTLLPSVLFEEFESLMRLVGEDVRVPGWFAAIVILLGVISVSRSEYIATPSQTLVVAFGLCSLGLMIIGWLIDPFEPGYGPNKMLYLTSFILFPMAIAELSAMTSQRANGLGSILIICATVGAFNAAVSPLNELASRIQLRDPVAWAPGVATSLNSRPDKLVTCLSTRVGGPPDDAWRCSRIMAGMQGMNYPPGAGFNAPYSATLNMIYGVNMCSVTSQQVSDIPEDDYQRLVLVISDGGRRSTESGCQEPGWAGPSLPRDPKWTAGVLSGIRWDVIEGLSYEGEVANFEINNR